MGLLFPHFSQQQTRTANDLNAPLTRFWNKLQPLLELTNSSNKNIREIITNALPSVQQKLLLDADAILEGDPAAKSRDEVILAYPGFFAIAVHRLSHLLYDLSAPTAARMLSEHAHRITGIDIHPGAGIGDSFFIDHGTGIVIGETTIIHENVKIYQGVTLGGLSVDKGMAHTKRHPTIERDVIIYANATILGGDTVIGAGSTIGGNVWLTSSVPPGSRVYHKGEITVKS